ncbi:hypothetical protein BGX20_000449 [Mortierella sp. AD010]|nr:hypothetical protein BGX20_000449 [Mortierella sp. AD010]
MHSFVKVASLVALTTLGLLAPTVYAQELKDAFVSTPGSAAGFRDPIDSLRSLAVGPYPVSNALAPTAMAMAVGPSGLDKRDYVCKDPGYGPFILLHLKVTSKVAAPLANSACRMVVVTRALLGSVVESIVALTTRAWPTVIVVVTMASIDVETAVAPMDAISLVIAHHALRVIQSIAVVNGTCCLPNTVCAPNNKCAPAGGSNPPAPNPPAPNPPAPNPPAPNPPAPSPPPPEITSSTTDPSFTLGPVPTNSTTTTTTTATTSSLNSGPIVTQNPPSSGASIKETSGLVIAGMAMVVALLIQ